MAITDTEARTIAQDLISQRIEDLPESDEPEDADSVETYGDAQLVRAEIRALRDLLDDMPLR